MEKQFSGTPNSIVKHLQFDLEMTLTWFMTLTLIAQTSKGKGTDVQITNFLFVTFDLGLTKLVLKLDPDMVNIYHHTKNGVSMSTHSKVTAYTDT